MTSREVETRLVYVSFGVLAIYAPVETVYSWPGGLGSPYYIIDVIAIVLIFVGAVRSLRARPARAPGAPSSSSSCVVSSSSRWSAWRSGSFSTPDRPATASQLRIEPLRLTDS
jgi:hypothetical protein